MALSSSRPFEPRARSCVGLLALFLAALEWQCGAFGTNECHKGETACVNNAAMHCAPPCSDIGCTWRWERQDCAGATCIVPRGSPAMCAANPVVDARCNDRSYCDGDQPVICAGEYALERLAHCGPTGCAERSDGAQCVVPLDPACSSGEAVFCTVFQERIECSGGRIVSRTQCAVCENNRCVPDGGASSDAADVSDVSDLNDVRDEPDGFDASSDIATDAGD